MSQRATASEASALQGVSVGEHVGERASAAVQAVRRSGLKPALERSFGCTPEQIGEVIAQEPLAGRRLARNSMVTLYVGAPGDEQLREPGEGAAEALVSAPENDVKTAPERGERPRRRKPGLAAASTRPSEPPPPPDRALPGDAPAEGIGLSEDLRAEELADRAEALFAEGGGARAAWRMRAKLAGLSLELPWRLGRRTRRWGAAAVALLLAVTLASALGSRGGAGRSAINDVHRTGASPIARERAAEKRRAPKAPRSLKRMRRVHRGRHRGLHGASRPRRRPGTRTAPRAADPSPALRPRATSSSPPPAVASAESEFSP